ncbi:glycosyltransferase [bacterium]|nr:glycosyltransferase [bacterium]MBU1995146.1 glycosyltransferase [bacterium]
MKQEDSMHKIALIMSVYKNDKEKYVKECLESLLFQTCKEFDIFIQFDGRVERGVEAYLDALYKNNTIAFLNKRDENKGLAYSLNALLDVVLAQNYAYIARMDADDICDKHRIQKQYDFMSRHVEVDVCGGFIEEFNMDTNETQVISYPQNHDEILQNFKKRNSMAHVSTFFRSTFFKNAGVYDTSKLNEDFDLWIRGLSAGCRFYNLQEVLVKVRTDNAFFARRKNIKRAKEIMELKFQATKIFSFGISGYLYGLAHFVLFMLPSAFKQFIYKNFR